MPPVELTDSVGELLHRSFQVDRLMTIQDILRVASSSFLSAYALPTAVRQVVELLERCRTSSLGGHVRRCPNGHVGSVHYNSCRHRFCPQCSWMQIERWLVVEKQRLLRCPHYHVIFTIPSELRPLWCCNRAVFGHLLFQASSQSLLELLDDGKYLGARPGLLLALHTWTKQLTLHPHIHALVTGGGMTRDACWKETRSRWLLPKRVLMHKYRGKLRALLREALLNGHLRLPKNTRASQLHGLLNRMGRLRLNVKILERYDHGQGVVTYLARYLRGGPLSNRRLIGFQNGHVVFRYLDRKTTSQPQHRTLRLPVNQFLRRYFQHVPPRRFPMVRRYGLYANTKSDALNAARRVLSQPKWERPEPPSWAQLLVQFGVADIARCPVCQADLIFEEFRMRSRAPPVASTPSLTLTCP